MDFDDLDELEEQAGAVAPAGATPAPEEAAGAVAPAGGQLEAYVPWEYFPPIKRNYRLPDFDRLPPAILKQVLGGASDMHLRARPKVCIRAFVFYGAGDTWYAWAELAAKAPPYCEVAVYEWPSHGDAETSRGEEEHCASLDKLAEDAFKAVKETMEQHASGGRIAGAPFVLIGHSIGCLLVTALAQKLRERLQLEPSAVVMLDRGPPHMALHSEFGQRYIEENEWDFMRDYNYPIYKAALDKSKSDAEKGLKILKMWINDIKLANDTRPIGAHRFQGDLIVLRAMQSFKNAWLDEDTATDDQRRLHEARAKVMGSPPGCFADFTPEQFEEWSHWAAPGKFVLHDIDASHMSIKTNPEALQLIWDVLMQKKAADPR